MSSDQQVQVFEIFSRLGDDLERRWRGANYRRSSFPRIAAEALEEYRLHEKLVPLDIAGAVIGACHIPAQEDLPASFGDAPVTLYRGPRFHVSALYWLDGTTVIHQHRFSGAFQVLAGSSIHCRYSFDRDETISDHFVVGDISRDAVEVLRAGDVRSIESGGQFIHSVFHLDRPSISIVVRTYQDDEGEPQYTYHRPSVALNPFLHDPLLTRRVQIAAMLVALRTPDALSQLEDLVRESDAHTCFHVLQHAVLAEGADTMARMFGVRGENGYERLVDVARRRHGALVDLFSPVFEEQRRQTGIINRRATIAEADHRFFLALLLHGTDRQTAVDLVRQWRPQADPVETLVDWIDELSRTRAVGSTEPNVIGVEIDADALSAIEESFQSGSPVPVQRLLDSPLRPLFSG